MPKPNAVGRLGKNIWAPEANGLTQLPAAKRRSPNGRQHIALLAALVVSSITVLAIPIARTQARTSHSESVNVSDAQSVAIILPLDSAVSASRQPGSSYRAYDVSSVATIPQSDVVPTGLLEATARAAIGTIIGPSDMQAPLIIQRGQPSAITLHEDGFVTTHVSTETTVGQAISALGITVGEHDSVWPGPSVRLSPGAHVYVRHATSIRLMVASAEREYFTQARTVGELLTEAGIGYEPTDRVFPHRETTIRAGIQVHVTTIRNINEVTEEGLEFDTVYQYDPDRPDGEYVLLQAGDRGTIRREYRVRLINGIEVKREFVTESVSLPTQQILLVGTYVAPTSTATARPVFVGAPPDGCGQTLSVYATWYTAASSGGSGTTATGTAVYKGIVAVDPRVIPLGTQMYIPGYGYGLAADTGGGIKGNMIDLGYGPDDVYDWRTRWVDICILP